MKKLERVPWQPGHPPGELAPLELAREGEVQTPVGLRLWLCRYSRDGVSETTLDSVEALPALADRRGDEVLWLHAEGVRDFESIQKIGRHFGLHPLALEDVVHPKQRAKHDEFDDHHYVVLRSFHQSERTSSAVEGVENEQVSLFFGRGWVVSIEESPANLFAPVRSRLERSGSRLRTRGADYLAYALLDTLIDQFFPVLEAFDEHIERLEDKILTNPEKKDMESIQDTRRDLLDVLRATWPLRDVIVSLRREQHELLGKETKVYLRDCADHAMQIVDRVESYRDVTNSLAHLYLSSVSQTLNEVMKVLTIIGSIFIPLTFIAGVYGMNFSPDAGPWSMPELRWAWAYPVTLLAMVLIALGLLVFFRVKKWL